MSALGQMFLHNAQNPLNMAMFKPPPPISVAQHRVFDSIPDQIDEFVDTPLVNNNSIPNKEIPMDENKIHVTGFIPFSAVQSPDQKPPPAELTSVISRLELVENRLDQVDNHIALLRDDFSEFTQTMEQKLDTLANQFATLHSMFLSMMKSSAQPTETSPPLVPESVSKSSDHQSGTSSPLAQGPDSPRPATPSKSQVLSAWNGTNSPIKAAASRSPPTHPLANPSVTAKAKPITAPSIQASDPPPRPKASQTPVSTSATSRTPRRAKTSPPLAHTVSRVAEGEPPSNGPRN